MKRPKKPTKKSAKPQRTSKLEAPPHVFYLLDSKGALFDVHKTRIDAWFDAVGPRFYKGFYIVEYARHGMRRYAYKTSMKEDKRGRR